MLTVILISLGVSLIVVSTALFSFLLLSDPEVLIKEVKASPYFCLFFSNLMFIAGNMLLWPNVNI